MNAPHEIIQASRNVQLYDEELQKEVYKIGIHTRNEMVPIESLYDVALPIVQSGKFLVTFGSDHSITSTLVKAHLERWPSLKVLQFTSALRADDPQWYVKVVDELPEHVYFTIDVSGINDGQDVMIVTRELTYRRNIVGFDMHGQTPADLCAKLIYKILGYVFQ
ncbi:MAG TPA: arginase family protein [Acidobacteriota bacterium]|nr:arginase family protein [Acidobacteriota bacterium]